MQNINIHNYFGSNKTKTADSVKNRIQTIRKKYPEKRSIKYTGN